MLAEGADARKESEYGDTPLFAAAMGGHNAIVELLLAEYGLNSDPQELRKLLSWAAEIGNEEVVRLLLSKDNVDPDSIGWEEKTPLSWAAEEGH